MNEPGQSKNGKVQNIHEPLATDLSTNVEALPRLVLLFKERPAAWALMPEALERVKAFCKKTQSDDDPEILAAVIEQNFASEKPLIVLMVAVDPSGDLLGHLLADIEEWGAKKYLVIRQYDLDDKAGIPVELLRAGLEAIEEWGRMHGAMKTRVFALNDEWERGLRTFYGFRKNRTLMERSL